MQQSSISKGNRTLPLLYYFDYQIYLGVDV